MPKRKTTISYGKAARTPSQRKGTEGNRIAARKVPMNKPKPRSELLKFVEEEREKRPGVSTLDLIREFRDREGGV